MLRLFEVNEGGHNPYGKKRAFILTNETRLHAFIWIIIDNMTDPWTASNCHENNSHSARWVNYTFHTCCISKPSAVLIIHLTFQPQQIGRKRNMHITKPESNERLQKCWWNFGKDWQLFLLKPRNALRLGSHLRQIFEMSEEVADNFVSKLVRDN